MAVKLSHLPFKGNKAGKWAVKNTYTFFKITFFIVCDSTTIPDAFLRARIFTISINR